jgi:hypothetical protein
MFGLTFWENWYLLGDSNQLGTAFNSVGVPRAFAGSSEAPELKLVYYTGHTLQGSYKGG